GRNGAGKTTTVELVAGLRAADAGTVRVAGLDPWRDRDELRQVLGMQLQSSELPERLKVHEAMSLFASFARRPARVDELLEEVGLVEKRDAMFRTLSGGQRQRLSIALALVGTPDVVIFDELTTGLDPSARRDTWRLISSVRDRGVTVVLVTHFMEEAERLCDRVAVVDGGRIVDIDRPSSLVARHVPGQRIWLRPTGSMEDVLRSLETLDVTDVHVEAGTLDDAFLALTGTALED
ncbi:MAG TPA: ABC transporter ATP-binding protein, partial [Acidimicrobiales bacterium]|nr:ABC transporter ATP-binding protein [Acidimicrobiales bacterium]